MIAILMSIASAIAGGISAAASSTVGKIAIEIIKWIAFKGLVYLVLFTVVPILLYNILLDFTFDFLKWGLDYISAGDFNGAGLTIQLTGMAGYIASQIGLPSMFSMFMTAVGVRFMLNLARL